MAFPLIPLIKVGAVVVGIRTVIKHQAKKKRKNQRQQGVSVGQRQLYNQYRPTYYRRGRTVFMLQS